MVKSDGNGSMIVDKNLWKFLLWFVALLVAITGAWGTSLIADVNTLENKTQLGEVKDAQQDGRIDRIYDKLETIEALLRDKK